MKISLKKIRQTPLDFEIKSDEITFKGYLEYHSNKLILLHAHLDGPLKKDCDSCAEEITIPLSEEVEFFISDGLYEGHDEMEFDVVESFDGIVDLNELLHSEIELIKSDYHRCDNCENKF